MIKVGGVLPEKPKAMPQSLLDRLEGTAPSLPQQPGSWLNTFFQFYRSLMQRPILAMGTAAAILLIIVVTIPYVKAPQVPIIPESAPVPSTQFQDKEETVTEPTEVKMAQIMKPTQKEPASPGRIYRAERRKMKPKRNLAMPQKAVPPSEREASAEEDAQPHKKEGGVGSARPAPVSTVRQTGDVRKFSSRQTNLKSRSRVQAEVSKRDLDKKVQMQPRDVSSTMENRVKHSMTRVNVVIVGAERVQVPLVEFTPPPSLKDRYTFVVSRQAMSETKEHKTTELSAGISEPEALAPSVRNLTVLVRISKLNGSYRILADILDSKSGKKGGTTEEIGVSQDELGRRIESVVSSLIRNMDGINSEK
jgi:hypothetical protein